MFDENYKFTCVERFLKYVKYDTQSDEESESFPSSEKQKILSQDLANGLKEMGIEEERAFLRWISASEGQLFAQTINEIVEKTKKLGPNPLSTRWAV